MSKTIRVYIDDSTTIVDTASAIMDNESNMIGGMRIAGEMRETSDSPIESGYLVELTNKDGMVHVECKDPVVAIDARTEDAAMKAIISAIEKAVRISASTASIKE